MPPLDPRIFGAILILGAASILIKAWELYRWWTDGEVLEPVVIDSQTNGGVRSAAWSGTSQTL